MAGIKKQKHAQECLTLNVKEAAAVIGIGYMAMYDLCRRTDFPAIRVGRRILIPRGALMRWLETQAGSRSN